MYPGCVTRSAAVRPTAALLLSWLLFAKQCGKGEGKMLCGGG